MKKLIFAFLLTLLIACSQSLTGVKSKYPFYVGYWRIDSPVHATLVGKDRPNIGYGTNGNGDTVVISSPTQVGLTIVNMDTTINSEFRLIFIDSVHTYTINSKFPTINDSVFNGVIHSIGFGTLSNPGVIPSKYEFSFEKDESTTGQWNFTINDFSLTFYNSDNSIDVVYKIAVDSMVPALQAIGIK